MIRFGSISILAVLLLGCGGTDTSPATTAETSSPAPVTAAGSVPEQGEPAPGEAESKRTRRGPVSLGLGSSNGASGSEHAASSQTGSNSSVSSTFEALKPLQILMGQWEGKTRRTFGGFAAVDEPEWVWDFLTDRNQPALVMKSKSSPYFEQLRMTFDPSTGKYVLTSKHADYGPRAFEGEFIEEVKDIPGDNDKLQRTYELQFTQTGPAQTDDEWQIVFSQRDNNRYLMEMSKKRGTASFQRFDTIAAQRHGTSFALSDSDYGEKTCIVSGGLGTATVSYKGKMYYVCCSGCSAAFTEEPERWIAKALGEKPDEE
ncbi:MAG TPA: hypothetical protein VLA12_20635 [Planctomycetaceae bacterium]|nr:hypothetical protein [Planctomycetaceae bacterium]